MRASPPPTDQASQPSSAHPLRVRITPEAAPISARPYLSIVVPAYNEEKRLPATLDRMGEYLSGRDFSWEVTVVDDGSRDGTASLVRELGRDRPWLSLLQYVDEDEKAVNRGKGFAVRQGMLHARGRDVLFSDADLSTPIEELEKLLPPISRGDCDISIASRALPESKLPVHQPFYREWMGRAFNRMVQRAIHTSIVDTQCGFKAFRGDVARHIFGLARIDGFGFDTEIVFLASKLGYRVREVPVTWRHADDSRVNPLLAPLQMMQELLAVRLADLRGEYDEKPPSASS
jgi:dolichyl-phosphate beta-glucosyltransferase